jgi:hypothetical protein
LILEKSFQIEKKEETKKSVYTFVITIQPRFVIPRDYSLSTIGLHPPPPPAYYTQIMMVAHWKPVIAGFNPVASVYFILFFYN